MVINIIVEGGKALGNYTVKKVLKNLVIGVTSGVVTNVSVYFASKALIKAIKNKKEKETENNGTELQEVGA